MLKNIRKNRFWLLKALETYSLAFFFIVKRSAGVFDWDHSPLAALEYLEYPLGAVPLGTEPAGMFGGGNRKKLKARVVASSGGQSTLELLQAIEDVKTNLIVDADIPSKWNTVNAGSGGAFNFTDDYAELTVTGLTQDKWIGLSMDIVPKTVNVGDRFTVSVPLYIDSSVPYDAGAVCIKEHATGKVAIAQNLPDGPKDKWFNLEFTKTAGVKLTDTTHSFYIFLSRNGSIKVGKPTLYYTNEQPSSFKDNAYLNDIGNGELAAFDGYKAIYLK